MANFTLYNKRNGECPICGDTSGKCRTKSNSPGELILCMNLAGEAKGTIIDGYKCLGDTSDGNWAKFVPDNTTEWTQQQREEWRRERELKRLKNDQEEKKRQSESLSPEERDKQYQKILDELPLHEEDRKDLTRRGFTNEQITRCRIKSVDQWQKLKEQYPHLLPGVNITGDGLNTQGGYLCPIRNADGLIVAIQVRLRVVTGGKGEPQDKGKTHKGKGRYRWLTSKTKKRPHGQSPHVYPQGKKELPLAVFYPEQGTGNGQRATGKGEQETENEGNKERKQHQQNTSWCATQSAKRQRGVASTFTRGLVNQIGICEGTGAKPFLTSQRLGMPVIGAAGGQFASSPLTFQESLEKVARKISLNQVNKNLQKSFPNKENIELVIYPDAGDVKNPQVMRRWKKLFKLLQQWGWKFKIAWWGQGEKSTDHDIDELNDFKKIKYLTPKRFIKIAQGHLFKEEGTVHFPPVTVEQGAAIARRYKVETDYFDKLPPGINGENTNFWKWVQKCPAVGIILVNDRQTANNLIKQGYAAICPNSQESFLKWAKKGRKWEVKLEKALGIFCRGKRQFYLVPNKPNPIKLKPQSHQETKKLLNATAFEIIKQKCGVKIIEESLNQNDCHKSIRKAPSFSRWQVQHLKDLNVTPDLELRIKDLKEINIRIPDGTQLVLLKSPKGTGKTELLIKTVQKAKASGRNIIYLTHRINLGREGCQRLGLRWVEDPVKGMGQDDLIAIGMNKLGISFIEELIPPEDIQGDIFEGFNSNRSYSKSELIPLLLDQLGIEKLEDLKPKNLGLCSDSLRRDSQAGFYPSDWYGADVILDEGEQFIWHTLNSRTEVSKHRVEVLENFQRLIRNAVAGGGRIFLSDADLSDISVNYIHNLAGQNLNTFTIVNNWQPEEKTPCLNYQKPEDLYRALEEHIAQREKAFVCCSSQKTKSTWSTQNLETSLKEKFPYLKILRIDAESVADPNHPAYGCTSNLNAILPMYDVVLVSPVIETGVSITIDHFDSVWAFAGGSGQSANSVRQAMARVRPKVTRHIWVREKAQNFAFIAGGETNPRKLINTQQETALENLHNLSKADALGVFDEYGHDLWSTNQAHLTTWAKMAARINGELQCYRETVLAGLELEGYQVIDAKDYDEMVIGFKQLAIVQALGDYSCLQREFLLKDENSIEQEIEQVEREREIQAQKAKDDLKQVKEIEYEKEIQAELKAGNPDDDEFEGLSKNNSKTQNQRLRYRHGTRVRRYLMELDENLIRNDDNDYFLRIYLDYYRGVGRKYLQARDLAAFGRQITEDKTWLYQPDFNRSQWGRKIEFLESLPVTIEDLENHEGNFSNDDKHLEKLARYLKKNSYKVKQVLGIKIKKDGSNIEIVNQLLKLVGKKMPYQTQQRINGKKTRIYGALVSTFESDRREEIFEQWVERDQEREQKKLADLEAQKGVTLNSVPPKITKFKQAESLTQSTLEGVTVKDNNLYIQDTSVTPEFKNSESKEISNCDGRNTDELVQGSEPKEINNGDGRNTDELVQGFEDALSSGREFALKEAVSWSYEELDSVVNALSVREDPRLLNVLVDVDFESDMEKLKPELGIVDQPKRQNYLEEYGLPEFIGQLTSVAVHYGKQWASSLMESLTSSERTMVLSKMEENNPPLFAQLISWGLGSEGLSPDIPF